MHGKVSPVTHNGEGVFQDIPDNVSVMRYHSLIADEATFPKEELEVTARINLPGKDEEIMGVRHKKIPDPRYSIPSRVFCN